MYYSLNDYRLNEIVNIILIFGKTKYNYHTAEKLYLNLKDILLNNIQMQCRFCIIQCKIQMQNRFYYENMSIRIFKNRREINIKNKKLIILAY
jgi:hypothetical protein